MIRARRDAAKAVASVRDVARMVGLSRSRFYQLLEAGVFPAPSRGKKTDRPFYTIDQQRVCLEVRERNRGVNDQVVLFYTGRRKSGAPSHGVQGHRQAAASRGAQNADIIAGVRSLGLPAANAARVQLAVQELFPAGIDGTDLPEVIRAVFLRLRRSDAEVQSGRG